MPPSFPLFLRGVGGGAFFIYNNVMTDKKPITKRRTTQTATRRGKKQSKAQARGYTPMPAWRRNLLVLLAVSLFIAGFYGFFVRPYAYRWKPCSGMKGYGVCLPCNYDVHGIDISHYQGDIEWQQLAYNKTARFPIHFVFMKATEGGDLGDPTFAHNFAEARRYGFIRGAYHYFIPQTDPVKQAEFFIRTAPLEAGDLPPVLDVETTGKKKPAELKRLVKVWLDKVEAHYGVKPILYTSYKFKKRYLNDSIFNTYPYWIAHYYVDSVRYEGKWNFWQHTDAGTVPGIPKQVDLNVFNGTPEELQALTLQPAE